jgi:hypothetical protein
MRVQVLCRVRRTKLTFPRLMLGAFSSSNASERSMFWEIIYLPENCLGRRSSFPARQPPPGLDLNPGLRSRFAIVLEFEDLGPREVTQIVMDMFAAQHNLLGGVQDPARTVETRNCRPLTEAEQCQCRLVNLSKNPQPDRRSIRGSQLR